MNKIILFVLFGIVVSCKNNSDELAHQQQATVDSLRMAIVKQQVVDSMNQATAMQNQALPAEQATYAVAAKPHATPVSHTYHETSRSWSGQQPPTQDNYQATATKTKKGWSGKAKGAVIGTGVGALTGALVDKKKGRGAIIGGLLGAGAGTGVGAIIDKRENR